MQNRQSFSGKNRRGGPSRGFSNSGGGGRPNRSARPAQGGGQYRRSGGGGRGRAAQNIDPARFINKQIREVETVAYESTHQFTDFGFTPVLQANIDAVGYKTPSAIQDQAIPLALAGNDVIGLANTGTGKTAAFLLPVLQRLNKTRALRSVLIMAPTRELAQQIDAEFRKFSAGMKLYSAVCVGGLNIGGQIRQLQRGPHVIIGTPGRLKDLQERSALHLANIEVLVLDEVDRMLDMGFVNDIRHIVGLLPTENRQSLCFSATLDPRVTQIIQELTHDPMTVSVKVNETSDHIYQDVVHFHDDAHKKDLLVDLLKQDDFEKVIIFGETKFGVQRLSDMLQQHDISSVAIHGNKTQGQRTRALAAFQNNDASVLVATDVAARGLDVPNVSHVINFDLPNAYDDYVHRIGRTGRGGKNGTALTFVKK